MMNNYAVVYMLFGAAAFLPGLLSDPFNSRLLYSIENDLPSGKSDGLCSYEFVPIKSREKRQTQITFPSNPPNKTEVHSTIWANKTRDVSSPSTSPPATRPGSAVDEKSLLRNKDNHFAPNTGNASNVTAEEEDHVPTYEELEKYATEKKLIPKNDTFLYYDVHYIPPPDGQNYWVNINTTVHQMLSNAHRRAATIKLKFDFLFYGHKITNVTIATGGFIYLGEAVHAWLAATQYVAPLMGNFISSISPNSTVSYYSGNSSFTVQWNQLQLHDSPDKGNFTFQATLHKNGTILFVYKSVPIPISSINDTNHPVKVGLSDAYIRDRNVLVIKQKTIYEYHRVDVKDKEGYHIVNGSAIIFSLRETCLNQTTCEDCTNPDKTEFNCFWCPKRNRCSSGLDRHRQDWIENNCEKDSVNSTDQCPGLAYTHGHPSPPLDEDDHDHNGHDSHFADHGHDHNNNEHYRSEVTRTKAADDGTSAGGVIGIMFLLAIIFGGAGWLAYAYFYPHSPSGQLLIRYRPSAWGLRRGEARYTAASIHM